jgi:hypothetical protein
MATGRVGSGIQGKGSVKNVWNTKLARLRDGCRWFERGPGDFSDARALHQLALMMGSGEDTTDKIRRDGGCGTPGATHSNFQHDPCRWGLGPEADMGTDSIM